MSKFPWLQFLSKEHTPVYEVLIVWTCTSITYQTRYVNTIRLDKGCVTLEKLDIDNLKVEIVPFVIHFTVNSSICANIEENIKVWGSPSCSSRSSSSCIWSCCCCCCCCCFKESRINATDGESIIIPIPKQPVHYPFIKSFIKHIIKSRRRIGFFPCWTFMLLV